MRTLLLSDGVTFHAFDSHSESPLSLVEVSGGARPKRFTLPEPLADILRTCGKPTSEAVLQERISEVLRVDLEQAKTLLNDFLIPQAILDDLQPPETLSKPPTPEPAARSVKGTVTLLSPQRVALMTRPLALLFNKWIVIAALVPTVISQYVLFTHITSHSFSPATLSGPDILIFLALSSLSGLWHELGHASALRSCGETEASIGWGLYLWFPVLYTDLSRAWRLSRGHRVIVDLGGIYFHLIFLCGLTYLACSLSYTGLLSIALLIDLEIAFALNPFFKMDGYWILADTLGISDLRGDVAELMFRAVRFDRSESIMWRKRDAFIATYCCASITFFVFTVWTLLRNIVFTIPLLRPEIESIYLLGHRNVGSGPHELLLLVQFIWHVLFLVVVALMLLRGLAAITARSLRWRGIGAHVDI